MNSKVAIDYFRPVICCNWHAGNYNQFNEDSHESDEPEINSLSDEEERDRVCSDISDNVSSTEEGENEEYGSKHEESNVFVSKDGTKFHSFWWQNSSYISPG